MGVCVVLASGDKKELDDWFKRLWNRKFICAPQKDVDNNFSTKSHHDLPIIEFVDIDEPSAICQYGVEKKVRETSVNFSFWYGAVRKLRKGVFSLSWTTHPPSYIVESKAFTK